MSKQNKEKSIIKSRAPRGRGKELKNSMVRGREKKEKFSLPNFKITFKERQS
jgi:hypothetical protein